MTKPYKTGGEITTVLTIAVLITTLIIPFVVNNIFKKNPSIKTKAEISCPMGWSCVGECASVDVQASFTEIYPNDPAKAWRQEKAQNCGIQENECDYFTTCSTVNSQANSNCDSTLWFCAGECANQAVRNTFQNSILWRLEKAQNCGISIDDCLNISDCPKEKITPSPSAIMETNKLCNVYDQDTCGKCIYKAWEDCDTSRGGTNISGNDCCQAGGCTEDLVCPATNPVITPIPSLSTSKTPELSPNCKDGYGNSVTHNTFVCMNSVVEKGNIYSVKSLLKCENGRFVFIENCFNGCTPDNRSCLASNKEKPINNNSDNNNDQKSCQKPAQCIFHSCSGNNAWLPDLKCPNPFDVCCIASQQIKSNLASKIPINYCPVGNGGSCNRVCDDNEIILSTKKCQNAWEICCVKKTNINDKIIQEALPIIEGEDNNITIIQAPPDEKKPVNVNVVCKELLGIANAFDCQKVSASYKEIGGKILTIINFQNQDVNTNYYACWQSAINTITGCQKISTAKSQSTITTTENQTPIPPAPPPPTQPKATETKPNIIPTATKIPTTFFDKSPEEIITLFKQKKISLKNINQNNTADQDLFYDIANLPYPSNITKTTFSVNRLPDSIESIISPMTIKPTGFTKYNLERLSYLEGFINLNSQRNRITSLVFNTNNEIIIGSSSTYINGDWIYYDAEIDVLYLSFNPARIENTKSNEFYLYAIPQASKYSISYLGNSPNMVHTQSNRSKNQLISDNNQLIISKGDFYNNSFIFQGVRNKSNPEMGLDSPMKWPILLIKGNNQPLQIQIMGYMEANNRIQPLLKFPFTVVNINNNLFFLRNNRD